jgi:hypothetical protein
VPQELRQRRYFPRGGGHIIATGEKVTAILQLASSMETVLILRLNGQATLEDRVFVGPLPPPVANELIVSPAEVTQAEVNMNRLSHCDPSRCLFLTVDFLWICVQFKNSDEEKLTAALGHHPLSIVMARTCQSTPWVQHRSDS